MIKAPEIFKRGTLIPALNIKVGDIVALKDPANGYKPILCFAVLPFFHDTVIDGKTVSDGLSLGFFPIEMHAGDKIIPNDDRHYFIPRDIIRNTSTLDVNNNHRLVYHLREIPLNETTTGNEDLCLTRVGQMSNSRDRRADFILAHAFGKLGEAVLMTTPSLDRSLAGALGTKSFSKKLVIMGEDTDDGGEQYRPELGTHVFDYDFLKQRTQLLLRAPEPKPKAGKHVQLSFPKKFEIKNQDPDVISRWEADPDNIVLLCEIGLLTNKKFWDLLQREFPDILHVQNLLVLDDREFKDMQDFLRERSPERRLEFIRALEEIPLGSAEDEKLRLRYYTALIDPSDALTFKAHHPHHYDVIKRQLESGKTLEEVVQYVHKSHDNELRALALKGILSAAYLHKIEKHPELKPKAEEPASKPKPKPKVEILPLERFDITIEDAIMRRMFDNIQGDKTTNYVACLSEPVEGKAPSTLREAFKVVSADKEALVGRYNHLGKGLSRNLAEKIIRVNEAFNADLTAMQAPDTPESEREAIREKYGLALMQLTLDEPQ